MTITFKIRGLNLAIYATSEGDKFLPVPENQEAHHWVIQKAEDKPLYKPKDPNNIKMLLDGDEISFDGKYLKPREEAKFIKSSEP